MIPASVILSGRRRPAVAAVVESVNHEYISLTVMRADSAITAERIDVLFEMDTLGYPRNIVGLLDEGTASVRGEGRGFDAAFARLLWPLVFSLILAGNMMFFVLCYFVFFW